eukprot:6208925-Pleurochrysis_carterae.AAC.6
MAARGKLCVVTCVREHTLTTPMALRRVRLRRFGSCSDCAHAHPRPCAPIRRASACTSGMKPRQEKKERVRFSLSLFFARALSPPVSLSDSPSVSCAPLLPRPSLAPPRSFAANLPLCNEFPESLNFCHPPPKPCFSGCYANAIPPDSSPFPCAARRRYLRRASSRSQGKLEAARVITFLGVSPSSFVLLPTPAPTPRARARTRLATSLPGPIRGGRTARDEMANTAWNAVRADRIASVEQNASATAATRGPVYTSCRISVPTQVVKERD